MSPYRDHTAPEEPVEEYLIRIEREKQEYITRRRPKAPPTPLPPVPANALAMAPMNVVMV